MEEDWKDTVYATYPQIDFDAVRRPWDYVARMVAGVADSTIALVGGGEPRVHPSRCLGRRPIDSYADGLPAGAGPVAAVSSHTSETLAVSTVGIVCDEAPLVILESDLPAFGLEDHGDSWTLLDALLLAASLTTGLSAIVLGRERAIDFDLVGGQQGIMLAPVVEGCGKRVVAAPDWQHDLGIV